MIMMVSGGSMRAPILFSTPLGQQRVKVRLVDVKTLRCVSEALVTA